ncbi:MAG: hypothetical protein DSO03_05400 [Hadesarchaea archaeon]|nr:MAG: hypothetical protein DSO03_05400 [Hadesarchaea archaeon]
MTRVPTGGIRLSLHPKGGGDKMGELWDEIVCQMREDPEGKQLLEWISSGRCVCRTCNLIRAAMARRSLRRREK